MQKTNDEPMGPKDGEGNPTLPVRKLEIGKVTVTEQLVTVPKGTPYEPYNEVDSDLDAAEPKAKPANKKAKYNTSVLVRQPSDVFISQSSRSTDQPAHTLPNVEERLDLCFMVY